MLNPWTWEEKRIVVETYRRMHLARCPRDRALLTVIDAFTGRPPREGERVMLRLACPTCRRMCLSAEVEPTKHSATNEDW